MRIAFDLDGTLIPAPGSPMRTEHCSRLARFISSEQMRESAPMLLNELRRQGHEVWLYTSSLRSPARLRFWFASFGVRLDGIVNLARHTSVMEGNAITCSKYPPVFGIELLVDDADGVRLEGERHGFSVLCVREDDPSWFVRVKDCVRDLVSRADVEEMR